MFRWVKTLAATALALSLLSSPPFAADQQLVVTAFGGNWEQAVKKVAARFKVTRPNVDVIVTLPGNSAQVMAKLRAERANPTIDVVLMGGGLDVTALQEGLLAAQDYSKLPNYKDIYEIARNPVQGLGPSIGFAGVKLAYNTNHVRPPPTSWNALWDERYKGKVGMMNMTNNGGIMLLYLMSTLNGGSIENTAPGFDKLKTLKAQNPYFYDSNPAAVDRFVQGSIWISPMFDGRVAGLKAEGFPVDMVCPTEGCFVTHTNANIVAGSKKTDLALAFIDEFLSAESQAVFAEISGSGPVNVNTVLPEKVAQNVIYGRDEVKKLISLPWHEITPYRDGWVEKWNRDVLAK